LHQLKQTLDELDLVAEALKASTTPSEAIERMKMSEEAIDATLHQLLGSAHVSDIDDLIQMARAEGSLDSSGQHGSDGTSGRVLTELMWPQDFSEVGGCRQAPHYPIPVPV
jgi:hypothetical protein